MAKNEMTAINVKDIITSLELVQHINVLRGAGVSQLNHDSLLNVIRSEFKEEIFLRDLTTSFYNTKYRKNLPMFVLTINQANILIRRVLKTKVQSNGLYIIKAGEYYKIGITSDIISRIECIQTSNTHKLELIHYQQVEDALTIEQELHNKYDEQRMVGEWFDITGKDVENIIGGLND